MAKLTPDVGERADLGETNFYTLAAELVRVDGLSLLNHVLTRAGVSVEE